MKKRIFAVVVMTIVLSVLLAFSVSAETVEPHWIDNGDGTWSYMDENGELVKNETSYWIGEDCYGFDANGIMYTGWVQPHRSDMNHIHDTHYRNLWYYYDASGHAADGYQVVDGTGYLFYGNGQLSSNDYRWLWDAEAEAQRLYVSDEDGVATEITVRNNWQLVGDTYYYAIEEEGETRLPQGIYEVAGTEYYFRDGRLAEEEWVYFWDENDNHCEAYAQAGGHLIKEGWVYEPDGNVQYIMDGERLTNDWYEIEGERYYFDWAGLILYTDWYNGYFLDNGRIVRNQWYKEENGRYMYFDADGDQYYYGWHTIDEVEFYFEDGYLVTNHVYDDYDHEAEEWVWYVIDEQGYSSRLADGWTLVGDRWVYLADGELYSDGIYTIDGVEYVFDYMYLANEETIQQLYDEKNESYYYYLVNENGTLNRAHGWTLYDGRWVFGEANGSLRKGWLYDGGIWYYMTPTMYKNAVISIGGRSYYFDSNGKSTDVTINGFYKVNASATYYFEYGQPAYGWRQLGGNWYYFDPEMITNDDYYIGSDRYYFDANGIMLTGWFKDSNNEWRYADENGHLVWDEVKEIGGVTYFFDEYGRMVTDSYYWHDGVSYLLDEGGAVIMNSTETPGWKSYNGKWYYMDENGYYYCNDWYYIGERYYYFEGFTMVEEEIVDGYYYGKGGARVEEGWIFHEGKYYYAYPGWNGQLYYDGLLTIDDNEEDDIPGKCYMFRDHELVIGSGVYNSDLLITDASGAVIALQPFKDGWNLVNDNGNGVYYYVENGELYRGWKGDYYLCPEMLVNTAMEIDGKMYYFDENGACVKNGWIDLEFAWLYAKEDGSLVYNDWLNLNGVYYYFQETIMVEDGVFYIDGKEHEFAEGGAWIGECKEEEEPEFAEGWHLIDGVWHYRQNGEFLYNTIRKIDGTWYGFDYEGMATNEINDMGYYMNGSGIVQFYVGWKLIDGEWYYFGAENRAVFGWFTVDGVQYYGTPDGIATGYTYVEGRLYNFGAGGANNGVVTADGWYQNGTTWYYIKNGELVRDEFAVIDGVTYFFDWSGEMLSNTLYCDGYSNTFYLISEGGAVINTQGWYMLNGEWLYVDANGNLCNGTHDIDGTRYVFNLWFMFIKLNYYY